MFSDTFLFSVSLFVSKLLSCIMLPFYTKILTPSDYGTMDLILTSVSLLASILTLSISEAVLRFSLDKNESLKDIFSSGLWISLIGFVIAGLLIWPVKEMIKISNEVCVVFWLVYVTTVLWMLLSQFLRGLNLIKVFAISGIVYSVTLVISNVIFLIILKKGVTGYLLSIILSNIVSIVYIVFKANIKQYAKLKVDLIKLNQMLKYSVPLIFTSMSGWILCYSDKYILNLISGLAVIGIYSTANKLSVIVVSISDVFMKAWQISAVNEYENENRGEYYRQVYKYYNILLIILCSVFIISLKLVSSVLFSHEFFPAWKCASFLLLSAVISAINNFINSLYVVSKNTKSVFWPTITGGVTNIILNFCFIPYFHEVGAAVATLCGTFIIWLMRTICIDDEFKSVKIVNCKFCISYVLLLVQCIVMYSDMTYKYFILIPILLVLIFIFINDIMEIIKRIWIVVKDKTWKYTKDSIKK